MSAPARVRPRPAYENDCSLELTRDEREMLHCLLTIATQHPEMFGGDSTALCDYFRRTAADIQRKLPLRLAPTYVGGKCC